MIVTRTPATQPIAARPLGRHRIPRWFALTMIPVVGRSIVVLAAILVATSIVFADGGRVELSQAVDQYRVTVFRAPVPLQPGPIDISVLVQDVSSGAVIQDIGATVVCRHERSATEIKQVADASQATNQLLSSAKFDLPIAGDWKIQVIVEEPVAQSFEFSVIATEPQVSVPTLVLIALFPLLFFAVYLMRERIRRPST